MTKSILGSLLSGSSLLAVAAHAAAQANTPTLTMKDCAPYFTKYQEKYGTACALSVDVMEQIMEGAESEEAMLTAMHEAMTSSDEEDETAPITVVREDADSGLPAASDAFEYADQMDDKLAADLETNAKAALENKRGAAVIALDLIRLHKADVIVNVWPQPGSEGENGTKYIGNRLADYYKTIISKDDGSSTTGERSWYRDYLERSKAATKLMAELKSIKAVTANEQAPYILPEHEAVRGDKLKIKSRRSAIDGGLTNKKNAIVRAVNLIQRMAYLNEHTQFKCEIMMEGDTNIPVQSNKLIQVWDEKDPRTGNVLTIGQLLALKVIEGGTYSAITGTTQRKGKAGTGAAVQNIKIDSVKAWDDGLAAFANYIDDTNTKLKTGDAKQYNALLTHLNADGSDDTLLSMNSVMEFIEGVLSKPGISKKLGALIADGKKRGEKAVPQEQMRKAS